MAQTHLTVTVRCRFAWLLCLLWLCIVLPPVLRQAWADAVLWLACWQINYGSGWERLNIRLDLPADDDDDSDGGTPVPVPAYA